MIALWVALGLLAAIAVAFTAGIVVRRIWRVLPAPTNFAEGQRALYGMLGAAAGMVCGALAIAMIGLLMWGGWSKDQEHTIVVIFGCTLGGFIAAMSAVIIGLLAGGPVGRFKATVGKDGASFEAETEGPALKTTTTTTVGPSA